MLGRALAEATGTADICAVLKPADFPSADSYRYLLHEDGEMPFFVLKSKQGEYTFTDRAFVVLDGGNAVSKKRLVNRYPLSTHEFRDVKLETAGNIDLDIEIKFSLGGRGYSIDVEKKELDALTALYKALVAISEIQARGNTMMDLAKLAMERAAGSFRRAAATTGAGAGHDETLVSVSQSAFEWLAHQYTVNNPSNFGPVFARYINTLPK
jgi:hypothetical protein